MLESSDLLVDHQRKVVVDVVFMGLVVSTGSAIQGCLGRSLSLVVILKQDLQQYLFLSLSLVLRGPSFEIEFILSLLDLPLVLKGLSFLLK